jgi:hypothetical protein
MAPMGGWAHPKKIASKRDFALGVVRGDNDRVESSRYRAVANVMFDGLALYFGKVYTTEELAPSLDELIQTGCVVSTVDDREPFDRPSDRRSLSAT